jgi:SAM-dependent methyltransferase
MRGPTSLVHSQVDRTPNRGVRLDERTALMTASRNATAGPTQHWPDESTELYLREGERLEAMNGPLGDVMLDAASLRSGDRVLDIGCGRGTTTIDAATRTTTGGAALGVDISGRLLQVARRRAVDAGVGNAEFLEADAQTHEFEEAAFDAVISRFGVMFFDDPEAAFANFARAVRPGGRLAVVCPGEPLRTEWIRITFTAVAPHVGLPDLGPPGAPGPFAFADPDRLAATIRNGGSSDVSIDAVTRRSALATTSTTWPPSSPLCPRVDSSWPASQMTKWRPPRTCSRGRSHRMPGHRA